MNLSRLVEPHLVGPFYRVGRIGDIRSDEVKSGGHQDLKAGRSHHPVSNVLFFFMPIYDS